MPNRQRLRFPPFSAEQNELGLFITVKHSQSAAGSFDVVITSHEGQVIADKTLSNRADALRYVNGVINKAKAKDAEAMIVVDIDPNV